MGVSQSQPGSGNTQGGERRPHVRHRADAPHKQNKGSSPLRHPRVHVHDNGPMMVDLFTKNLPAPAFRALHVAASRLHHGSRAGEATPQQSHS